MLEKIQTEKSNNCDRNKSGEEVKKKKKGKDDSERKKTGFMSVL